METRPGPTQPHCMVCVRIDPDTSEGYTFCCNKRLCDGPCVILPNGEHYEQHILNDDRRQYREYRHRHCGDWGCSWELDRYRASNIPLCANAKVQEGSTP